MEKAVLRMLAVRLIRICFFVFLSGVTASPSTEDTFYLHIKNSGERVSGGAVPEEDFDE